ncbi:helix-turn-helix domain-containing protein [Exiguobacterium sp. SH0S1]|uniref:HNH endonuclease n=1 Tax=Exiguobacterium sp. SH0S1 TaxID=2510949 RepID=UPI001039569D|nr:HNH endonuclease [Exiguobacterium sp. SH0S1]TCI75907.1 helix-turn-helix domain-containing protein [Exiguobacterium sp. SH0S1]
MDKDSYLTTPELIEELKLSRSTIYRMVREGMPYIQFGRDKHFNLEEVKAWVETRQRGVGALSPGTVMNNDTLAMTFKCSTQGGMRRSNTTHTLVVISDHSNLKNVYEDKWMNDILYYTGMGLTGDQVLEGNQNKTLYESNENGIKVYLFEVYSPGEYTFIGQVALAEEPFQTDEEDQDGNLRKAWKFPLKIVGASYPIPEETLVETYNRKEKQAKKLDSNELKKRAKLTSKSTKHLKKRAEEANKDKQRNVRTITSTAYDRNPYISEYVKRLANGVCQLCEKEAPFKDATGEPFLETHHVKWLSNGGEDTIENCAALCPNCHRKMHYLILSEDVEKLKAVAQKNSEI